MVRDSGGVLRTVTSITVRDAGGTLRTIASITARDSGGTLRTVFAANGSGAMQALTPSYVQGSVYSKGTAFASTDAATVNAPSGATIVWNFANSGWSAINPGALSTGFRKSVAPGDEADTQVTCTVTSNGNSYTTNAIAAHVENTYGGLN